MKLHSLTLMAIVMMSAACTIRKVPPDDAYSSVSAPEFKSIIDKNDPAAVLLDIRTPEEFESGHINGAVNIDFYAPDFKSKISALDKTKDYLIYCRSGNRSSQALKTFQELGFKKAVNLENGIIDWENSGFKLKK